MTRATPICLPIVPPPPLNGPPPGGPLGKPLLSEAPQSLCYPFAPPILEVPFCVSFHKLWFGNSIHVLFQKPHGLYYPFDTLFPLRFLSLSQLDYFLVFIRERPCLDRCSSRRLPFPFPQAVLSSPLYPLLVWIRLLCSHSDSN